ncbi:uncharacterized protein LOC134152847 [Rhea pennata]|uniref:uncharacterized protein LOC134152847 n=1 Tax=Rhea pennata TaxID=8795 RepID=UPI002E254D0B
MGGTRGRGETGTGGSRGHRDRTVLAAGCPPPRVPKLQPPPCVRCAPEPLGPTAPRPVSLPLMSPRVPMPPHLPIHVPMSPHPPGFLGPPGPSCSQIPASPVPCPCVPMSPCSLSPLVPIPCVLPLCPMSLSPHVPVPPSPVSYLHVFCPRPPVSPSPSLMSPCSMPHPCVPMSPVPPCPIPPCSVSHPLPPCPYPSCPVPSCPVPSCPHVLCPIPVPPCPLSPSPAPLCPYPPCPIPLCPMFPCPHVPCPVPVSHPPCSSRTPTAGLGLGPDRLNRPRGPMTPPPPRWDLRAAAGPHGIGTARACGARSDVPGLPVPDEPAPLGLGRPAGPLEGPQGGATAAARADDAGAQQGRLNRAGAEPEPGQSRPCPTGRINASTHYCLCPCSAAPHPPPRGPRK